MLPQRLHKYLTEEERQRMRAARIGGRIEGLSLAVLKVLESRNVPYSRELMARLTSKSEPELHVVIGRAVSAARAEELLD